ncbi:hypothetical protein HXX76_007467 [Chlamydomonas incerta]|uniref:Uncharacterized protein n=1 Tax=Chlamydomonas incerta TaxID=51695 RepID=A0A835TCD7_CHLIN|nr:hypothetical protein HXX76_007467 [Chlamydomonas incerta]|eukprot:KAG2435395.1 hypothetical protein HXX76_007467 [Chlamydomonas incerta]
MSAAVEAAFGGEGAAQWDPQQAASSPASAAAATAGVAAGAGIAAGAGAVAADAGGALGAATMGGYAAFSTLHDGTDTAEVRGQEQERDQELVGVGSGAATLVPSAAASGPAAAAGTSGPDAAAAAAARRALAGTYPSLVANGSASATFPAAAFGAWCAADSACAAAGSLNLSLLHTTDAASVAAITSAVLNWPSPLSAASGSGVLVTGQALVSGVVELQLEAYAAKKDAPICSAASGAGACSAQLVIPLLSGAVDVTKSTACIRLEPTILGSGYQAVGYPTNGTDGTAVVGIITNNALRCNTTKFGKHLVMQYKQTSAVPPSPPAATSPPPPAPPPPLNATGAVLTSEVELKVEVVVGVSFDDLAASNDTLTQLKTSLESSLAASLDSAVPALLLLSRGLASASSGTISRISRYSGAKETAVTVQFVIRVPAGATEAQISALVALLTTNTTAIFSGSVYTSKFMGPAAVTRVVAEDGGGISVGGAVGIALGCLAGLVLLLGGGYAAYRFRAYQALLPKRPDGDWDEYGVAVVQPRKDKDRAARRERSKPSAVVPVESEAAAVVPPPWAGANAPTVDPAAAAPQAPQAPQAPVAAGGMAGAGAVGGAGGAAAGRVSDGGGGPGLKSEADLRGAWGY